MKFNKKVRNMKKSCRISIQERNCYCNGPGVWNMNMLQCGRCRRWYHDDCVQCLRSPMLLGDKFFIFVCALCNSNVEFLARLELKWVDIAHLVLYNLSVISKTEHHVKRSYFDFNIDMLPFLCENWSRMNLLGKVSQSNNGEWRRKLLEALQTNEKRFKCGQEIKKSRALWALRQVSPPVAPHVVPVKSQKEHGMWEFKIPGRSSEVIFNGKKYLQKKEEPISDQKQCNEKKSAPANSKCKESTLQNGTKKHSTKSKRPSFNEDVAMYDLLNMMIPILPDYKRNNPFKRQRTESKNRHVLPQPKRQKMDVTITNGIKSNGLANGITRHHSRRSSLNHTTTTTNKAFPIEKNIDCQSKIRDSNDKNGIHLKNGQTVEILGRRVTKDGKVQYLFEWKT